MKRSRKRHGNDVVFFGSYWKSWKIEVLGPLILMIDDLWWWFWAKVDWWWLMWLLKKWTATFGTTNFLVIVFQVSILGGQYEATRCVKCHWRWIWQMHRCQSLDQEIQTSCRWQDKLTMDMAHQNGYKKSPNVRWSASFIMFVCLVLVMNISKPYLFCGYLNCSKKTHLTSTTIINCCWSRFQLIQGTSKLPILVSCPVFGSTSPQ